MLIPFLRQIILVELYQLFLVHFQNYLENIYDLWFYKVEEYKGELKLNVHDKLKWIKPSFEKLELGKSTKGKEVFNAPEGTKFEGIAFATDGS